VNRFLYENDSSCYLTEDSLRSYKNGQRLICGVSIPEGMKEHQKFDKPIITPTTKAKEGTMKTYLKKNIKHGLVSGKIIVYWKTMH
jgi:phosphoribosylaminoimidazole-succinocarboxamide synthase